MTDGGVLVASDIASKGGCTDGRVILAGIVISKCASARSRVVAHSRVGTGKRVALEGLPSHGHVGAHIEPLDVSQSTASSVAKECASANCRVAINRVVSEREKTVGCVIAASNVALERSAATSRIAKACGVVK